MAKKHFFGEPVPKLPTKEIVSDQDNIPGLGWRVSEETRREIEQIEENTRFAEQRIGALIVR